MVQLFQNSKEFYDRILIQDKCREYTYMDWKRIADAVSQKVNERETVLVLCHNCSEILLGIISFLRDNLISILVDASLPQKQIDNTIQLYKPNYLLVAKDNWTSYLENRFYPIFEMEEVVLLKNKIEMAPVKNNDLAILLSTSGSTGSPKFVRLSYSNLKNGIYYINDIVGISKEDGCITVLPLNYLYCFISVLRHIQVGARIIVTDESVVKKEFWELCRKFHPNYFFGVPYVYESIFKLGIQSYLKTFKTLSLSGGKPSLELIAKINEIVIKSNGQFYVEYGQTEAGGMLAIDVKTKNGISKVVDSVGTPHSGCSLVIKDENNQEIEAANVEGELIYTGGNVFMGYANAYADLSKEDEIHSVLKTGDIGIRNSQGMIRIVGRAKRFIKICGKRYSLDHMESIIKEDLSQSEIALTGKDDLLVVFCTKKDFLPEIRRYIRLQYKLSVKNFTVQYIDDFPLKANGKIDYQRLNKIGRE